VVVARGYATLQEVETYWSLYDVLDACDVIRATDWKPPKE
jgi:hypothetical protein